VPIRVRGADQTFPVRRIYCIGRNCHDHAGEMGNDSKRDPRCRVTPTLRGIVLMAISIAVFSRWI
jgi:2-keto-4-pentenoate hydratase/2-oxohepta-3-ene-1,7-dioic acid hydratase in catechol pathway